MGYETSFSREIGGLRRETRYRIFADRPEQRAQITLRPRGQARRAARPDREMDSFRNKKPAVEA